MPPAPRNRSAAQQTVERLFASCLNNQPFCFFPSLEGIRVEDTVLATPAGTEILTATGPWPVREIEMTGKKFQVPEILVKKP